MKEVSVDAKLVAGWLLKRYLGHASSAQFRRKEGGGATALDVEENLVGILFERAAWPSAWRVGITSQISVLDTGCGGSLILDVGHNKIDSTVGVMEVTFDGVQVRFFREGAAARELATVKLAPVRLRFVNAGNGVEHTVVLSDGSAGTPGALNEIAIPLNGVDAPA